MFNGKSIFISGGTGSFGRNFIHWTPDRSPLELLP